MQINNSSSIVIHKQMARTRTHGRFIVTNLFSFRPGASRAINVLRGAFASCATMQQLAACSAHVHNTTAGHVVQGGRRATISYRRSHTDGRGVVQYHRDRYKERGLFSGKINWNRSAVSTASNKTKNNCNNNNVIPR